MDTGKIAARAAEKRLRDRMKGGGGHTTSNESAGSMRWLLTYADAITLMMALFIILFAMSSIDRVKFQAFAKDVSAGFDNDWAVNQPPNGGKQTQVLGKQEAGGFGPKIHDAKESQVLEIPEIQRQLEAYIKQSHLQDTMTTHLDSRGLVITLLSDNAYYDPGSAELSSQAEGILDHVSVFLRSQPYLIRVEGNTDNVPINTATYPSNWELSSARAINVVEYFVSHDHLDPHRLGATGYGEWRPDYPNDTPANRAKNRHVDVVILNAGLSEELAPQH